MRQVRNGVFETNSSSTHSITICTKEDYEKFLAGELMYDRYGEKLVPATDDLETEGYQYKRYEDLGHPYDDVWLETYEEHFKTPSGDEMVAFGAYGYDG